MRFNLFNPFNPFNPMNPDSIERLSRDTRPLPARREPRRARPPGWRQGVEYIIFFQNEILY